MSKQVKRCKNCEADNTIKSKYCIDCGESLVKSRGLGKKAAIVGLVLVTLIGGGLILSNALLSSPFDKAIKEIENIPRVTLVETTGDGYGKSGREVCESIVDGMERYYAIENMKFAMGESFISYDYVPTVAPYTKQRLILFLDYLSEAARSGTLQGAVNYNRKVKIISFSTWDPFYLDVDHTAVITASFYMYFE